MNDNRSPRFVPILITGLGLMLTLVTVSRHLILRRTIYHEARAEIGERVKEAAKAIDREVNQLVPINIDVCEALTSGRLPLREDAIETHLAWVKDTYPRVFGVGIAFVPHAFPNRDKYAPLLVNREQGREMVHIEDVYDYTEPGRDFYHRPLVEGPVWQEPHYGQASEAFIANFTAPVYADTQDAHDGPIAVVFTSMSLDQYQRLVGEQGFGATGYGFLLSGKGAFISHPDATYVQEKKTLADWLGDQPGGAGPDLVKAASAGVRAVAARSEEGREEWVYIEPITATGWILGVVYDRSHVAGLERLTTSALFVGGSAAVLLLGCLLMWVARKRTTAESAHAQPA